MILNPKIASLGAHPFPRIAALLAGASSPTGLEVIDLTIGEPRFPPPPTIGASILEYQEMWGKYPPNNGPEWFRSAAAAWLERRFSLPAGTIDVGQALFPVAGAREALYQLGFLVDAAKMGKRLFAMPTPHYAPYRAAAAMAGLEPFYLPADADNGYLPDLDQVERKGDAITLMLLCSPSNPEGAIASPAYLERAIALARQHDFLLVVDECYSELYLGDAPEGVLGACWRMSGGNPGADPFHNVLAVNSLSKRSSAAGLRVGMVCGDRQVIKSFIDLRAYCGGTTSVPNLGAAAALLGDESHVEALRARYRENFDAVHEILADYPGYRRPEGGMFLWLRVKADEVAALRAWEQGALRVIPGSYLGPPASDGSHPGRGHIRLAMVHPPETLREAALRLRPILADMGVEA